MTKKALVIGAGGFIGYHLTKRLKEQGWWVGGVDLKYPLYGDTPCDDFLIADASLEWFINEKYDRIYQLAADMGGAGFVFTGDNDADILRNSAMINMNVLRQVALRGVGTIFYSSSVCCYPDEVEGKEEDAYPANPPSNYGWEKLFSERLYQAYAKNKGVNVRIARFHNTFGPYGTYDGGREKAPAAICRKVLQSNGIIEVWGDGEQLRPFVYIDDLIDGIEALMESDVTEPVNLGPNSGITINQLIDTVASFDNKDLIKINIPGPTGGQIRNANNDRAVKLLHWSPKRNLNDSLRTTYDWIKQELSKKK